MIETLVWILMVTSDGVYNRGTVAVVGHYNDRAQCEHVQKNLPGSNFNSKCVQSRMLLPK